MFNVKAGGSAFNELTATEAASKARDLRCAGFNDVEIFRLNDIRISQYSLDQVIRSEAANTANI